MKEFIESIKEREAAAIMGIPVENDYETAISILSSLRSTNNKVVCSGMGKAGQVANNLSTTLASTGTPAIFLHPSEAQHGDLGILQDGDVLCLISNSGKTREILELKDLAQRLAKNLRIIAITGHPDSPLGEVSDVCLYTGNPEEVCPLGLTPTTSITVMTVICDMLVTSVMKATNFSKEEYALRHHSGYLGTKARHE